MRSRIGSTHPVIEQVLQPAEGRQVDQQHNLEAVAPDGAVDGCELRRVARRGEHAVARKVARDAEGGHCAAQPTHR